MMSANLWYVEKQVNRKCFAMLQGSASLFSSWFPRTGVNIVIPREERDEDAIRGDWCAVGRDLVKSQVFHVSILSEHDRQHVRQELDNFLEHHDEPGADCSAGDHERWICAEFNGESYQSARVKRLWASAFTGNAREIR